MTYMDPFLCSLLAMAYSLGTALAGLEQLSHTIMLPLKNWKPIMLQI